MGLVINETKTKCMKTNGATMEQQDGDVITIGGQRVEVVDEFVYLGALIRAASDNSAEIKRRIMSANRCFSGLQRHLRSKLLKMETKCSIYKTLIRPVLLYGSESWPTTKKDETRAPLKLFNSEPAGRRGVGRPKNRWSDNVTADLKALGVRNWREAAQDRQRWNQILDQARSKRWM